MEKLLCNVEKELEAIGEKGLSLSNLEVAYKLIDIYKDIKEADYYEEKIKKYKGEEVSTYSEEDKRCMVRLEEGMKKYRTGRDEFNLNGSNSKMLEGLEMIMGTLVGFISGLMAQSNVAEKDLIKRHIGTLAGL